MTLKRILCTFVALLALFSLSACGENAEENTGAPEVGDLKYESTVPLQYADQFAIYKYEGGYSYIEMVNSDKILVVPEGKETPDGLAPDIVVIQQPLNDIYLVSTAAISLFDSLDALDRIAFIGTNTVYIDNAIKALEDGVFVYAGKYNAPDYEMLLDGNCQLAIESTMILHNPDVKEKLNELGIKTIVERSSYEEHPLGRTEWIKLYGALLGLEDAAEAAFQKEVDKISALEGLDSTGKTVAFFYVNSAGNVVTYKTDGYVPAMIRIAGGEYIFSDLGLDDDNKLSTINMNMEEFYNTAASADIIIYNCSIISQLSTLSEFLALSPVLEDFKAVKEDNVWCTGKSLFQQTDKMGTIIQEMNAIFTGNGETQELEYIFKLK
ncbi:MAG: ABC transporter substrate-binding protein [Oscillospiraceae bacterium]|nr:ABC transporter substrate-binding protein [Oscillospiraceae bacterium]